jgi:hypothetical protein
MGLTVKIIRPLKTNVILAGSWNYYPDPHIWPKWYQPKLNRRLIKEYDWFWYHIICRRTAPQTSNRSLPNFKLCNIINYDFWITGI